MRTVTECTGDQKPLITVYGDGVHDDTAAIQAFVDGTHRVIYPDGRPFPQDGNHRIESAIQVRSSFHLSGMTLTAAESNHPVHSGRKRTAQWKRETKRRP